jgi:hypothetical protein
MAKKTGRPATSDRDDIVVKLDRAVAAQARYIAETRGVPLAEYLTSALRPVVAKDFQKVATEGGAK